MLEYTYRAYAERVIDGDSYQLRVDLGFHVATTIKVRLYGVNTPELGTLGGADAMSFAIDFLRPANVLWDEAQIKPTPLKIKTYRDRMSFNRWVCEVWRAEDGLSLAEHLINNGHGVEYMP